jgi:hypothetical protein
VLLTDLIYDWNWNYRIQDDIKLELYYLMVTIASDQKRQPNLRVM